MVNYPYIDNHTGFSDYIYVTSEIILLIEKILRTYREVCKFWGDIIGENLDKLISVKS